jgi:hypothetical protein
MRTLAKRLKKERSRRTEAERYQETNRRRIHLLEKKVNDGWRQSEEMRIQIAEAMNLIYVLCSLQGDEFKLSETALLSKSTPYIVMRDPQNREWIFQKKVLE